MTDQPYTTADLLAEAARQHKAATEDPDFSGISEQMEGHNIPSRGDFQWDQLDEDDFDKAQRAIDDLIGKAADISRWAVGLGEDGLEPGDGHVDIGWSNGPLQARLHIAFTTDVPHDERAQLLADISDAIAGTVPVR
ncbi:hypothetical protein [Streptomyces sp. NPDC060001]|uniref:hypothetical protein n=1 Tax=Streptomyces sp. NPDC060001 TaxID=3347032 RepID=UPI0036BEF0CC